MILPALRRAGRFLSSARFATLLLVFLGTWSVVASFLPQGEASKPEVAAWASAHPLAESVVRALGLHDAFAAPLFALCVLALAVSTALCAWQRTKAALARGRVLRGALALDRNALAASHDLEIACDPALTEAEVLTIASGTLGRLGIHTRRHDTSISAVSVSWSVWGSPVFHWALLALIVAMLAGSLLRSSGQMGLAVGEAKIDAPESYGFLSVGPLRDWAGVRRIIRVDGFDLKYTTGGVDRGPTPTVSVLDADGAVVKSQRVYPNHTLSYGSLTIYPSSYGLATTISMTDSSGTELGRSARLADFSTETTEGTVPAAYLVVHDAAGNDALKVLISVVLDPTKGGFSQQLPASPAARVVVTTIDDKPVLDGLLRPGDSIALPTGDTVHVIDIGYYARLQLVDDPSIPMLYAGLAVAMIGLGIATLGRQQIVSAIVMETPDGTQLAVKMRLWRNVTSSRSEIESELAQALGGVAKGDMT